MVKDIFPPDRPEDLLSRYDAVLVAQQIFQQPELPELQIEFLSVPSDLMGIRVESEPRSCQHRAIVAGRGHYGLIHTIIFWLAKNSQEKKRSLHRGRRTALGGSTMKDMKDLDRPGFGKF